jgi:hypothetical protein
VVSLLGTIALLLFSQVPAPGTGLARVTELHEERESLRVTEADALEALAVKQNDASAAAKIREAMERPLAENGPIRFIPLPELVPPRPRSTTPRPAWQGEVDAIRGDTVKKLVALASKAAAPGLERFGIADECLRAALARDPDQPDARRLLGFLPREGGGWATPHAIKLMKAGMVLDPQFDWVPEDWLPKLRAGMLPGKKVGTGRATQWLPADQANALRNTIDDGWVIETTPHFLIKTDVPLAEAVEFGRRLEAMQDVFFSLFADVIGPANLPLAQRYRQLDAKSNTKKDIRPVSSKQYEVYYFANKDEYVTYLRRLGRDESISLGVYLNPGMIPGYKKGRSFFYRDVEGKAGIDVTATLYHEVSHQLVFETAGQTEYKRNAGQYWVWEGLGTYFETLVPKSDGSIELGGWVGPRLAQARIRLIEHKHYKPIGELTAMTDRAFGERAGDAVYDHYPEAMALVVFLMHYDRGIYREGFLDYVKDAYHGKMRNGPPKRALENHVGVPSETLDEEFTEWMAGSRRTRRGSEARD